MKNSTQDDMFLEQSTKREKGSNQHGQFVEQPTKRNQRLQSRRQSTMRKQIISNHK